MMEMDREVKLLLEELALCPETLAVAVGGSRAAGRADGKSDYDVYVYVDGEIGEGTRRTILTKYCGVMEIGNHYWETEDNCTLKNGVDIDIIYRNPAEFEDGVADVVERFHASNGYTTCMWHNLMTSVTVYDRDGRLEAMRKRFNVPYPPKLREAIIKKNRALLNGVLPSYDAQIKKAAGRGDFVSVNHRVTEFLASYFDILFAFNREMHPGEKRLVAICKERCAVLPECFVESLNRLFAVMYGPEVNEAVAGLVKELDRILEADV